MMGKMLKQKTIINLLIGVALIIVPLLNVQSVRAASATLYLSPASSSVTNGSTFTVNVRVNSGTEKVNAAEIHLSYPTSKLDFVRINDTSTWGFVFASSGGSGAVRIDRGANPSVSGDSLIASVQFKAKSSSGTATVSIGSNSEVISASSGDPVTLSRKSATYSFKAPAPAAQVTVDKKAPKISKAPSVSKITRNSAVVSWSTSEPSTSEVVYGLNTSYGLAAASSKKVTEHSVELSSSILTPGNTYHYMVKSVDSAGNAVSSDDATFATEGYDLDAKVINQKNSAVSGAKITIDGKSGVTDRSGQVTISDLPLGTLAGTVEHQGKKTIVSVTIDEPEDEGKNQSATFKIETAKNPWLILAAIAAGLAVLAAVGWQTLKQRRSGRGGGGASSSGSSSSNSDSGLSGSPPSTIITPTSGGS